jgi:acyl carrier protein
MIVAQDVLFNAIKRQMSGDDADSIRLEDGFKLWFDDSRQRLDLLEELEEQFDFEIVFWRWEDLMKGEPTVKDFIDAIQYAMKGDW